MLDRKAKDMTEPFFGPRGSAPAPAPPDPEIDALMDEIFAHGGSADGRPAAGRDTGTEGEER